jgi:ComF family protein
MLRELFARSWDALPGQCAICRRWPARTLCDACVNRFAQPLTRCITCALPVPGGVTRCGACLRDPPPLDRCIAAVTWGFPWSASIASYKFGGQPGWAATWATLLRSAPWAEPALEAADCVVPMPLSVQRLRERGFNQALEIARRLSPVKTDAHTLLRIRDTAPQRSLDREGRLRNVHGAFAVEPARTARLKGHHVLVVDDVMTSGASLHAAALALRQAGAAHVSALVLARTDEA